MNTFGISIPGLRIAGGLIVAFIGFRMLFPQPARPALPEASSVAGGTPMDARIAFVPLAMPSTAGPGTIAMIISSASTSAARHGAEFAPWIILTAPPPAYLYSGQRYSLSKPSKFWCHYAPGRCQWDRCSLPSDGVPAGLYRHTVHHQWHA